MSSQKQKFAAQIVQRVKKLRAHLKEKQLDAFLVSAISNRHYLTGWRGDQESGFVLVTPRDSFIITDSRYGEQAAKHTREFKIIETSEGIGPFLRDITSQLSIRSLGFESHDISVFSYWRLKKFIRSVRLVSVAHLVESLRAVKSEAEITHIKKSADIAEKAFKHILDFVLPGMSEVKVARELERFMKEKEAERNAWEPFIVAAGTNSSMAHWGAGSRKIKKNDMILLDYGCVWEGYACDISRVIFVGSPSQKQKQIYNLVLEAQNLGLSLIKEGKDASIIDKKVQQFLEKHPPDLPVPALPAGRRQSSGGQAQYVYCHALGHGVGLEVHELPYVNALRKNKLVAGNVITIEPGVYIPGWGGVRIEDMALVTKKGRQLITKAPKGIKEVTI